MAGNNSSEFNVILGADIDQTQLRKAMDEIHQIGSSGKPIKINVDIDVGASQEIVKNVSKELETLSNTFKNVNLSIDNSKQKAYEESLKRQEINLKELNKALQERNKIEIEIAKLENSKSYNTRAQQAAISLNQQLLTIENKRIESLSRELQGTEKSTAATDALQKADLQLAAAQQKIVSSSKQNIGFLQNMTSGLKEATARIFDYTIAYRAISGIGQIFRNSINDAIELDKTLVDLQIVTGGTREETNKLLMTYNEMAQSLGSTTQAVAESANDFLRQGLTVKETNDMIEASQYLSKLGMIDNSEATQYITSATKGYGLAASEAMDVVDKLTKVDINAAVSSGYLAEAMSRTANSAQQAGVDMDTLIGYIATIGETTQRSASTVGESLKTMFARFGNVKAGVFTSGEADMEALNDIEKVFKSLGISIRDTSSEMRDVDEILGELAGKWSTLTDVEKNATATAAAGVRQRENFLVLMNNYSKAIDLQNESLESAGTASKKYEAYQDSVEASINRVKTTFEEMILSLNESSGIKGVVDIGNAILQVVSNAHLLNGAILALVGSLGGKLVNSAIAFSQKTKEMEASTSGLIGAIKRGNEESKAYEGILSTLSKKQKVSVLQTMLQENSFKGLTEAEIQAKLATMGLSQAEAKSVAQKIVSNQAVQMNTNGTVANTAVKGINTAATNTATAAQLGLNAAANSFPFTWIFAAIGAIVGIVTGFAGELENATEKFDALNTEFEESSSRLEDYQTQLKEAEERQKELLEAREKGVELTSEEQIEIANLEQQIPLLDARVEREKSINELLEKRKDSASKEATEEQLTDFFKEGTIFDVAGKFENWGSEESWKKSLQYAREYYAEAENKEQELYDLQQQLAAETDSQKKFYIQGQIQALEQEQQKFDYIMSDLQAMRDAFAEAGNDEGVAFIDAKLNQIATANDEAWKLSETMNALSGASGQAKQSVDMLTNHYRNFGDIGDKAVRNHMRLYPEFRELVEGLIPVYGDEESAITAVKDRLVEQAEAMNEAEIATAQMTASSEEFSTAMDDFSYGTDIMSEYADSIDSITEKMEILSNAQEEFNATGAISAETLSAMTDNNLLGYLDDLYNGTLDAANMENQLTAAAQTQAATQLIQETATKLTTLAKAAQGDADAQLAANEYALQDAIGHVTNGILNGDIAVSDFTGSVGGFFNLLKQNGANVEDWLTGNYGKYDKLAQGALSNLSAGLEQIKNVQGMFKAQEIADNRGTKSKSKKSSGSGSKKGSGSSSKTDNVDHWKEAFDKEYDTLKHNREMDIISEKEYLDQLEKLNQKYFAGRAKYLDEYRKYEEEVYKGRKKELEEQKDAEIDAAKEVYEAQKDAIEKQKDALEDQRDAYQEIINKRKELLSTMQEEKSYQDELTDKNNNILDLENRIAELRYDTSAEGTKKRLELEDELAKSVKEKEDYMYDHSVTTQQDALDKEYDNYSKFIDDSISKLDESLDALEKAFEATTKAIEESFTRLIDALNDNAIDGGAGGGFNFGISNLSGQRGDAVREAQEALNSQYGAGLNVDGIWGSKTQKAYVRAVQQYLNDNFGAGLNVDGIWGSKTQSAWESAGGGAKPFHKGIEEGFVGGVEGNEMFAKLLNGELVTNEGQQNRFMDKILPQLLGNTAQAVTETISNGVNIDMDFNVAGNMDESVIPQVRNAVKEIIETYFIRGQKRNVRAFSI